MDSYKWYVVTCADGKEVDACERLNITLKNNNILNENLKKIYMPHITKKILIKDQLIEKKFPLYEGYIFIQMKDNWNTFQSILDAYFFGRFLCKEYKIENSKYRILWPSIISEEEMEKVFETERMENKTLEKIIFQKGDIIECIEGSFKNFVGTVVKVTKKRILFSVFLAGRNVNVDISPKMAQFAEDQILIEYEKKQNKFMGVI